MKKIIFIAILIHWSFLSSDGNTGKNDGQRSNVSPEEEPVSNSQKISDGNMIREPVSDPVSKDNYLDPGMSRIIQVAIVVRDIETSSKKWAEILGMPVPEIRTTRPGHEVDVIYRGEPSDGQVKLTFFNLGQVVLELLEPISEGTSWWEFLETKGEGVQHIGFKVESKEKASRELNNAGYSIFHQGRYDSDDGTYIYFDTQDALGVVVELLHSDPR